MFFKKLCVYGVIYLDWFCLEAKMLKLIIYMIMLPTIALSQEKIGDNSLHKQDWFH
jgi:hypothetical protein